MRRDKRFTGDDLLHDPEVTRDIARLRRERREGKHSQRARPKLQSNDTSRRTSKATPTKD